MYASEEYLLMILIFDINFLNKGILNKDIFKSSLSILLIVNMTGPFHSAALRIGNALHIGPTDLVQKIRKKDGTNENAKKTKKTEKNKLNQAKKQLDLEMQQQKQLELLAIHQKQKTEQFAASLSKLEDDFIKAYGNRKYPLSEFSERLHAHRAEASMHRVNYARQMENELVSVRQKQRDAMDLVLGVLEGPQVSSSSLPQGRVDEEASLKSDRSDSSSGFSSDMSLKEPREFI